MNESLKPWLYEQIDKGARSVATHLISNYFVDERFSLDLSTSIGETARVEPITVYRIRNLLSAVAAARGVSEPVNSDKLAIELTRVWIVSTSPTAKMSWLRLYRDTHMTRTAAAQWMKINGYIGDKLYQGFIRSAYGSAQNSGRGLSKCIEHFSFGDRDHAGA